MHDTDMVVLPMHVNDIKVLATILFPYSSYINSAVTPIEARIKMLATIDSLKERIESVCIKDTREPQSIQLSLVEIKLIKESLTFFMRNIPVVVASCPRSRGK